jgi:hypothetical protein
MTETADRRSHAVVESGSPAVCVDLTSSSRHRNTGFHSTTLVPCRTPHATKSKREESRTRLGDADSMCARRTSSSGLKFSASVWWMAAVKTPMRMGSSDGFGRAACSSLYVSARSSCSIAGALEWKPCWTPLRESVSRYMSPCWNSKSLDVPCTSLIWSEMCLVISFSGFLSLW